MYGNGLILTVKGTTQAVENEPDLKEKKKKRDTNPDHCDDRTQHSFQ